MKSLMHKMALAGLFALAAGSAGAAVSVTYIEPEKFSDLPFVTWEREDTLKTLTEHFTWLGSQPAAGPGPAHRGHWTSTWPAARSRARARAATCASCAGSADWPRIDLRFAVEQNGQVLKSGEAQAVRHELLNHFNRYFDSEPLRYEKSMIDDWFEKTIGPLPKHDVDW
jgi:hypothetical protein